MTAIQEAKDLNILSLEELLGSLMTYELSMKQNLEKKVKKKKTVALKSLAKEEDEDSEDFKEGDDEELVLIIKKFRKFMKKKRPNFKRKPFFQGEASKD